MARFYKEIQMIKFLIAFGFLFSTHLLAETPSTVMTGAIVNTWTQATLRVTEKPFDLAIQGNGFFVLQLPNGEQIFSRYGEMSLTADGYLVHSFSQGKVLGFCGGEFQPINLSQFARGDKRTVVKSFKTELDGKIMAFYEGGYARQTCTLALALFNNPTKLLRDKHILKETPESGKPFIGIPQSEARGSIYGSTLEELHEQTYRLNIKSVDADRVAIEMEKGRLANEDWLKQRTLFYVYDLNVSRQELAEIEASLEKCGVIIKKLVSIAESGPGTISEDDVSSRIDTAVNLHASEVLGILGQDRFDKAKKFRAHYNEQVWDKFGTSLRFTGF